MATVRNWKIHGLAYPVTVISDGEPALPNLVRTATGEPIRHIEQALAGICALRPTHRMGLDFASLDVERLRHLIWNGYAEETCEALWGLSHLAKEVIHLNGHRFGPAVRRFLHHCQDLRAYLANNEDALIDYGERYRSGRPISTSRAEGSVEETSQRPDGQAPANALVAEWRSLRSHGAGHRARRAHA
jgi:hypothetical protein